MRPALCRLRQQRQRNADQTVKTEFLQHNLGARQKLLLMPVGKTLGELVLDVARHLETVGDRGASERLREEAIAQAACKAAVKARDRLTLAEVEQLVVALAATEMPYTCPHGRPTLIYTSFAELERKFGRA